MRCIDRYVTFVVAESAVINVFRLMDLWAEELGLRLQYVTWDENLRLYHLCFTDEQPAEG